MGKSLRALLAAAMLAGLTVSGGEAAADTSMCNAPEDEETRFVCEDSYLLGLHVEISVLLQWMAEMNGGEVPEAVQMPYAHGEIERYDCGTHFRCVESAMRDQLASLNRSVLEWQDTPLVAGEGVRFVHVEKADSPGADLKPWNDVSNFGWSKRTCELRCAITDGCAAVGYDAMQIQHGRHGYCTMKGRVTLPVQRWTGTMMIKASTLPF